MPRGHRENEEGQGLTAEAQRNARGVENLTTEDTEKSWRAQRRLEARRAEAGFGEEKAVASYRTPKVACGHEEPARPAQQDGGRAQRMLRKKSRSLTPHKSPFGKLRTGGDSG